MIKGIPSDCLDSQMKFTNLEAQHKDNPGYPLVSRAIYYSSRLLSKQMNAPDGFQHSDYDKIKKVYSIWICIQHAGEKDDATNVYSFVEIFKKDSSIEWIRHHSYETEKITHGRYTNAMYTSINRNRRNCMSCTMTVYFHIKESLWIVVDSAFFQAIPNRHDFPF